MKKIKISDKKFQRKFSTNNDATCKKIELDGFDFDLWEQLNQQIESQEFLKQNLIETYA